MDAKAECSNSNPSDSKTEPKIISILNPYRKFSTTDIACAFFDIIHYYLHNSCAKIICQKAEKIMVPFKDQVIHGDS